MKKVKVVVTGGACAGKSTAQQALCQEYGGKFVTVPETATLLLGGFPVPGKHLAYSSGWQDAFQPAVAAVQVGLETAWELVAQERGVELLICDRGLLDGAAYVKGGLPAFLETFQLDLDEAYARYDQVIHLESVATCRPELFGKAGNESRYESLEEAIALEYRTREVWKGHPRWTFVSGAGGIADVVAQVISLISPYLDREADSFALPDWAAGAVEVTADPRFKNKWLAANGKPSAPTG